MLAACYFTSRRQVTCTTQTILSEILRVGRVDYTADYKNKYVHFAVLEEHLNPVVLEKHFCVAILEEHYDVILKEHFYILFK